jgi:hypothetical protein
MPLSFVNLKAIWTQNCNFRSFWKGKRMRTLPLLGAMLLISSCATRSFGKLKSEKQSDETTPSRVELMEPVIIEGPACDLAARKEITITEKRWRDFNAPKIIFTGACAALTVIPQLVTSMSLPPSAPGSLLPESERVCTTANYIEDVFQIPDELEEQFYRAPSLEEAKETTVQCELPRNVALDSATKLPGNFRWRLVRIYLSHIALAGTAASNMTRDPGGNSSRFLLHFLLGSGRPVIVKDPALLEELKVSWLAKWKADGHPVVGKMFMNYENLISSDSNRNYSILTTSLGRFPLYFQKLSDGRYAIWVNDLYTFPLRTDNHHGYADSSARHGWNTWFEAKAKVLKLALNILGKEGEQFIIEERENKVPPYRLTLSDAFFHKLQFDGGAKDFQMFTMAVVDPDKNTIQYVQPPIHANDFGQALKKHKPRMPEDFDKMADAYLKLRQAELH